MSLVPDAQPDSVVIKDLFGGLKLASALHLSDWLEQLPPAQAFLLKRSGVKYEAVFQTPPFAMAGRETELRERVLLGQ